MPPRRFSLAILIPLVVGTVTVGRASADDGPVLELNKGDKIVLIGNTLAERMQHFGRWETFLHLRHYDKHLTVRNLGWSADTITTRLRSKDFPDHGHSLLDHNPDVILAFFGFNESFAGPEGLEQFQADLEQFITDVRQLKYPSTTYERNREDTPIYQDGEGEVEKAPQLVLVSPIANENLPKRKIFAADWNNENLALYTQAMQQVAADQGVPFVDLFTPTLNIHERHRPLTFNGVHLTDHGELRTAIALDYLLFGERPAWMDNESLLEKLHAAVQEKNLQHWYDYRAINGYYIYGGRKNPFGTVNFPAEFEKLRKMVTLRDQRVWDVAQGKDVPEKIDDSGTGQFVDVETNFKNEVHITPPEEAMSRFTLPEGFEIQLVASEVDFPDLENPVQFAFDGRGRIWVTTMASYPMYLPGTPVDDKVLILEDTSGDGKADKQTVFADGLHVPTGIELGYGGAFVAAQPNLIFLKDTDGDDRADEQQIVLHGFDSGDSHHAISAFEWGPAGELYFQEGTFHHSQVETPYGPERVKNAAVFRYEPRTEKFDVFISYGFANPWGHVFDKWGQNFVADASGGANYFGTAFSGDIDYPRKHKSLKQFLRKQWRPTAGCDLVTSRHFPDEMQGDYVLNNCIGFQGVLQYRIKDDGSGFSADPVEPLLRSSDPNFRPVDIQFGPDGALYVIDWFNPLVGHMQHSLRDPNRDKKHGRIWRIVHTDRPLLNPPLIEGRPIPELLNVLRSYETRTLYATRRELWNRPTDQVVSAVDEWVAGLKEEDKTFEHSRLEALWLKQAHDVVDAELLATLLQSEDYKVRAASTRVLGQWRDRLDDPLQLLQQQVGDEHPRVRLEAVRALSFFREPAAQDALDVAVAALSYDMDDYLDYTLEETMETLQRRIDAPSAVGPIMRLIAGGQVPEGRRNQLLKQIAARGNGDDLAYLYHQAVVDAGRDAKLQGEVLGMLVDAATDRGVIPAGDLSGIGQLVSSASVDGQTEIERLAIELAGLWKVESSSDSLEAIVVDAEAPSSRRDAALIALARIGGKTAREAIAGLTTSDQPLELRLQGAAALVGLDVQFAAERTAAVLQDTDGETDLQELVSAFLDRRGGSQVLAQAVQSSPPAMDVARRALRAMYAVGRSDAELSSVLGKIAGIDSDPVPLTKEEVLAMVPVVQAKGDAARGEAVFRRADLSCMKCHAVSKAGGQVGPDLSALGATSPIDYILHSISDPDQHIKEAYITRVVVTDEGQILQGIVASRTDDTLVLKDAAGKTVSIPVDSIEEEIEGKSLMPKGLMKFMTESELLDLAKFLSMLGKPNSEYAVRASQRMQRWRVLTDVSEQFLEEVPDFTSFEDHIYRSASSEPVYGRVNGDVPLDEVVTRQKHPVLYLIGNVEVTRPGEVGVRLDDAAGVTMWVDKHLSAVAETTAELPVGVHPITLRIDTDERTSDTLTLELFRPNGSSAEFLVVDGD